MNNKNKLKYQKYKKKYLILKGGAIPISDMIEDLITVTFNYYFKNIDESCDKHEQLFQAGQQLNLQQNGLTFFQKNIFNFFIKSLINDYLLCGIEFHLPDLSIDSLQNGFDITLSYALIIGSSYLPTIIKDLTNPPTIVKQITCTKYHEQLNIKTFKLKYLFSDNNNDDNGYIYNYTLTQIIEPTQKLYNSIILKHTKPLTLRGNTIRLFNHYPEIQPQPKRMGRFRLP